MTGLTCDFMDFTDSSLSLDPCDVNNHIETAFDLFLPVTMSWFDQERIGFDPERTHQ